MVPRVTCTKGGLARKTNCKSGRAGVSLLINTRERRLRFRVTSFAAEVNWLAFLAQSATRARRLLQHTLPMAEGSLLKSVTIKRGKDAPAEMCRGSAAAADGKCYFLSLDDTNIRVYDVEKDDWFSVRQSLYKNAGLAVIDGLLTTIGGHAPETSYKPTNVLQSLANRRWKEKFPGMTVDPALGVDNRKYDMAVAQTGNSLIVIGGVQSADGEKRVDILDTATSVWSNVHELPGYCERGSATIAGDELYVQNNNGKVFQCFLDELKDDSKPAGSVWTTTADLPYDRYPTLGSLCGQAVAIGGKDSRSIHAYDPNKDCWYEIGKMALGRTRPLVAQLSEDKLVVVGGSSGKRGCANDVIITEIISGVM